MTLQEFKNRSIEFYVIKFNRNISFIITLILIIISSLIIWIAGSDDSLILLIPSAITSLLFFIYYNSRTRELINNHRNYKYLTVEFKEMHPGFITGSMYFTLNFEYNLKQYTIDTKDIFSSRFTDIKKPMYDKYLNKKVLIAFNPKTNQVVVIDIDNSND